MIIAVIAVISEVQRILRSKLSQYIFKTAQLLICGRTSAVGRFLLPLSAKKREDNRFFRCFLAVIGKKYYICSRNTNVNLPIKYGLYISESVCAEDGVSGLALVEGYV